MAKVKQITAWVDSYPGTIGRIAKALGNAKVNITSFTAYGTGGESPIRLQVSSPVKAKKVLRDLGIRTTEEEVLRLTVSANLAQDARLVRDRQSQDLFFRRADAEVSQHLLRLHGTAHLQANGAFPACSVGRE